MNVGYLREAYLAQLKAGIACNLDWYFESEPWLDRFFASNDWHLPARFPATEVKLIPAVSSRENYDLENVKRLYDAFKHLSVAQATEERLWTYLSHVTFWDYMKSRWPVETAKNPNNLIRERYFFMGDRGRALMRQGIARLWWYGYVSHDPHRQDPFELTNVLLMNQDIAQQLLERSFSRNPNITRAILSVLADNKTLESRWSNRETFRDLMIHINSMGGVTVLDALEEADIRDLLLQRIERNAV